MPDYNWLQELKRRFFALRNGIVADTLRRSGLDYHVAFGLNIPQLREIAAEMGKDADKARTLWADTRTRESMMLAPMIFPAGEMTPEEAREWFLAAPTPEVADILCQRLLRQLPFARELAMEHIADLEEMHRYTSLRLLFNLLPEGAADVLPLAEAELASATPLTRPLAHSLVEEINYLISINQD